MPAKKAPPPLPTKQPLIDPGTKQPVPGTSDEPPQQAPAAIDPALTQAAAAALEDSPEPDPTAANISVSGPGTNLAASAKLPPVELPPPVMPTGIDPEVVRAAAERAAMAHAIHGLVDRTTVTPYDVRQGIRPYIQQSPVAEAAQQEAMAPLQEEQAKAQRSAMMADIFNKYAQARAGIQVKQNLAEAMRAAAALGAGARMYGSNASAGARMYGADVGYQGKVDVAGINAQNRLDQIKAWLNGAAMTPDQVQQAADFMKQNGVIPKPSDFGGKYGLGNWKKILGAMGGVSGAELAAQGAQQQATKKAMGKLTTDASSFVPFANLALQNLNRLEAAAQRLSDTGSAYFNSPIRKFQGMTGDTNVSNFNAALEPVVSEMTQLLGTKNANGSSIAQKRHDEIQNLVGGGLTPQQIIGVIGILRSEMQNRIDTYGAAQKALKEQAGGAVTKTVGGKTYRQVPGGWEEVAQ